MAKLFNQPFDGSLGDFLIDVLRSGKFTSLNIFVAFAKTSGVKKLELPFIDFKKNGGTLTIFVGIDLGGTSYEALTALLKLSTRLIVVHSESRNTYHPKIYYFSSPKSSPLLVVGSNNLTSGGLWSNFESSVIVEGTDKFLQSTIERLKTLLRNPKICKEIKKQEDLDELLALNYITKEIDNKITNKLVNKRNASRRSKLFSSFSVPSGSEEQSQSDVPITTTIPKEYVLSTFTIMWMESKTMTGGSRNILDLSMESRLANSIDLIEGAVCFFGIVPTDYEEERNITLRFQGIDYVGNTILFPTGSKANGTWRLQIKGVDENNNKITTKFASLEPSGFFLQNKILVFTKILENYYEFDVREENELNDLRMASSLIAYNGKTSSSKLMGYIE